MKILLMIEKSFDTSNYDEDDKRLLPIDMNKKVIGFFKDELGGQVMTEFVVLRPETYSYLMDDDSEKKKPKRTKKCVIKRRLKFNNYKDFLLNNKTILNHNKDLKGKKTTYPYETIAFKICESEMLSKCR